MSDVEDNKETPDENAPDQQEAVRVGGFSVSQLQLPFAGMFFSAMVLIIAVNTPSSAKGTRKYWEYGNALAAVTMFFSLLGFLMAMKNEGKVKTAGRINAIFLFLWCFVGACLMTFGQGPFLVTSNGYFSSWAMAVFSVQGAGISSAAMKKGITTMSSELGLFTSAVIVLVSCIDWVSNSGEYKGESIYALVLSAVTIVLILIFLCMERGNRGDPSRFKWIILACFAAMWIVEACLVTFRGPFVVTGNGYFGSWGGALTSVYATNAARGAAKS